jgi:hypothetical protein
VLAQVFDVADLEAGRLSGCQHGVDADEIAIRKNVTADEVFAGAQTLAVARLRGNSVVEK